MLDRFDGEAHAVADAAAAAALARELVRPGDVVLVKASRGVGLEVVAEALAAREPRRTLMGEVLIGGTASLLICIFLSPKFIEFLRRREFGQQIREEGPQEHHAKAGTPTMGGIIIFTAIAVPFLLLTDLDARSVGVMGVALACAALGFADDYMKLVKKRSLGMQGRWKLIITMGISVGLWLVATRWADLPDTLNLRIYDAVDRPRLPLPVPDLPRAGGHDVGGQPHRRARRPGRGLLGDRAARLHRDHVHDAPDRPRAGGGLPGRRVRGLPLVQLVPGVDLHGRHGVARARRGDRGARGDDQDRGAADRDGRDLRDRGALAC